jgi:hypothetical protein
MDEELKKLVDALNNKKEPRPSRIEILTLEILQKTR